MTDKQPRNAHHRGLDARIGQSRHDLAQEQVGFLFQPAENVGRMGFQRLDPASAPNELRSLIGGKIREGLVVQNWPGVLRSAATMVTGAMPPSQLLK